MTSLVQSGMYGAVITSENTTNGLYFIKFISEAYMLQNNTTIDGKYIYSSELVAKSQYLCYMQENTNRYWKHQPLQHTITFPTLTIIHPYLDVIIIRHVQDIPKKLCSMIQAQNFIQRHPIIMKN